ncbi:divergent polysaccharide deacetylase family protein [Pseudomonas sp. T3]|uniref:divergent polysaccharide deacetylase family protein n=1 Tax=Stutzerimonas urumqiensis TaxID=638269 RepID=UPI000EB4C89A
MRHWLGRSALCALLCGVVSSGLQAAPAPRDKLPDSAPKLTLIIDDVGQNLAEGRRVIALDGPVALAVLPDTPHAAQLARLAHRAGKPVMLHLPMAPATGPYSWSPGLDEATLQSRLQAALGRVPYAEGVNNHMGSRMTERSAPMHSLMQSLQRRHLFFVDSRTTPRTQAAAMAQQTQLASLSRDIFLDDDPRPEAIARQFRSAIALAREQGSVVMIGHPRPSTLRVLERELPKLSAAGIDWVGPKLMIAVRGNRAMPAHGRDGRYARPDS